jgi:hypothetical protein
VITACTPIAGSIPVGTGKRHPGACQAVMHAISCWLISLQTCFSVVGNRGRIFGYPFRLVANLIASPLMRPWHDALVSRDRCSTLYPALCKTSVCAAMARLAASGSVPRTHTRFVPAMLDSISQTQAAQCMTVSSAVAGCRAATALEMSMPAHLGRACHAQRPPFHLFSARINGIIPLLPWCHCNIPV